MKSSKEKSKRNVKHPINDNDSVNIIKSPTSLHPKTDTSRKHVSISCNSSPTTTTSDLSTQPEKSIGWIALLSSVSSLFLANELRLQKSLTCPPDVYFQPESPKMNRICTHLLGTNKHERGGGILQRPFRPSLFVGTRPLIASAAAYTHRGPQKDEKLHVQFREILTMPSDGGVIALDWEVPLPQYQSSINLRKNPKDVEMEILHGPIEKPVVIILHGINNDAGYGYVRSFMRACTNRGWNACGVNMRGCGGLKMGTPRCFNASYTGDLRSIIRTISARIPKDNISSCIFVVGYSLGANIITKYLGEEGLSGTLPQHVLGGVSLGNPFHIHSKNCPFPWGEMIGAGVKEMVIKNWKTFGNLQAGDFKKAIMKLLMARNVGKIDEIMAPYYLRNEKKYPFRNKVGFKDGEEYWRDASSDDLVSQITVPFLNLSSTDDFLVNKQSMRAFSKCLSNPNVLTVKTKCGGHLGWQEAPPKGSFGLGKSWADNATVEFIQAVLDMKSSDEHQKDRKQNKDLTFDKATNSTEAINDLFFPRNLRSKL